jgi:transcriptional regulator with XRE-family HTH domain
MVRGRKPNEERRRQIAELRQQGLTLAEIGGRLGVSRQCIHIALRSIAKPRVLPAVHCRSCGRDIVSAGLLPEDDGKVLCLACVRQCPETHFGLRLQAYRLAAGLTRSDLARRAGIHNACVTDLERRHRPPTGQTLARLVEVLGPDLLPPVPCLECGKAIVTAIVLHGDPGLALCLDCLDQRSSVPFGQRLRIMRLTAGLTRRELARKARVRPACIASYERSGTYPHRRNFARLVRALGPRLAPEGRQTRKWRR